MQLHVQVLEKEKVLIINIYKGMVRVNGAPIELVSPAPLR
jgi:hypothetical protein